MGDEHELASAIGWEEHALWSWENGSMTQSKAKSLLKRRIASITTSNWSAVSNGWKPIHYTVSARSDHYQAELAKKHAWHRANYGPITLLTMNSEVREKWKVGSFGMFSDFNDPAPILQELGKSNAIDGDANYYEATVTWKYRKLRPNGTWGDWKRTSYTFQGDRDNGGDGIKSWETHHFDHDFCDDNQEITDPEIYKGMRRFITKRPVYEKRETSGYLRLYGRGWKWVKVGNELCVDQEPHNKSVLKTW